MGAQGQGRSRLWMKRAHLALYAVVALLMIAAFSVGTASGESLGLNWAASSDYSAPGIQGQSCVASADFGTIYCVGGIEGTSIPVYTGSVQDAALSPSGGAGGWAITTMYPRSSAYESCVGLESYIYCVGGYNGDSRTNATYYAQPSLAGLGPWMAAQYYPFPVMLQSCVGSGNGIYCVGGYINTVRVNVTYNGSTNYTNQTNFALLSASTGLSVWAPSTDYPIPIESESCVAYFGYIYCVGGQNLASTWTNKVYYAPLTGDGIGAWTSTTPYPLAVYGENCAVQYNYIYCVGGYTQSGVTPNSYYAVLSSSGVGPWTQTTSYPVEVAYESCVPFYDSITCVGGLDGSSTIAATYSDSIAPLTPVTVTYTATQTTTSVESQTVTSTTTAHSTVTATKTITATSVTKTVSSTTSTETSKSSETSSKTTTSAAVTSSVQTGDQMQPQGLFGPLGSLLQVEPLALGAAIGVLVTFAALRIGRRKKDSTSEVKS